MFSFFRRSKKESKDSDSNSGGSSKDGKERKSKEKVVSKETCVSPTFASKDVYKNKLTIQNSESAPRSGSDSASPSVATESVLREHVLNASVKVSGDKTDEVNESKLSTEICCDDNLTDPDIMEVAQNNSGDKLESIPVLSYATIVKKIDPFRDIKETKSGHNVKPCGHGTVAISPRIPLQAHKKEHFSTPPESPVLAAKNVHNKEAENPVEISDTATAISVATLQHNEDSSKTKQIGACVEGRSNDTVTAVMKLRVDLSQATPSLNATTNSESKESNADTEKKNLINQEAKFQSQVNDLSKQLSLRDAEANKLRFQMEELQRDVFAKSAGMDRLQAELQTAHKESECIKQKLRLLEDDVTTFRQKNVDLAEELTQKDENYANFEKCTNEKLTELQTIIEELRTKIESLESQIETLTKEKEKLEEEKLALITERDDGKLALEKSIKDAEEGKIQIEKKWEQDFEKLRTVNILKEQQVMDDFEWKLREIHQISKRKLEEKDRNVGLQLEEAAKEAELKIEKAEKMMNEVEHLKSFEAEVKQLRGLTNEQQKSLDSLSQQLNDLKEAENEFNAEIKRLKSRVEIEQENIQHIQLVHNLQILDKERKLQNTLNEEKRQIAICWEERLFHECARLKDELEQLYTEERRTAIDNAKADKDQELLEAKKNWERQIKQYEDEIALLQDAMKEKDVFYRVEIQKAQTATDQNILDLRRIMDKIDMTHHEKFEKLVVEHERELEQINEETESKIKDMEDSWHRQVNFLRSNLELVREQMEIEAQEKIQDLIDQHRNELNIQWENLVHQKSEAVRLVEEEFVSKYKTLEEQFYTQQKSHESREVDLLKTIDSLKNEVNCKDSLIDDLQNNMDMLEGGIQVLNGEIAHQGEKLFKIKSDADSKIRGLQEAIARLQSQQQSEQEEFNSQVSQMQKLSQATIDQLQRKCQCLTKLFEEVRSRYERRESRQEDLNIISDLKQVVAEQEKDLACINEEKRYFQMKLMNLERMLEMKNVESPNYIVEEELSSPVNMPNGLIQSHFANQVNGGINFSIPPTIPECDDCEE